MSQGIKVSQAGFPVGTASTKDLVFSSDENTFRVFASGAASIVANGSTQIGTITHNLGYRPAFDVYSEAAVVGIANGLFTVCPFNSLSGVGDFGILPYVDENKLYIYFGADVDTAGGTIDYKYFVYHNPAK